MTGVIWLVVLWSGVYSWEDRLVGEPGFVTVEARANAYGSPWISGDERDIRAIGRVVTTEDAITSCIPQWDS